VGAVDISKVLRLSMPSMSRSYLLSFTGALHSKLERISVNLDIWASVRIVMVALSDDSRGGSISAFAKIHEKSRISSVIPGLREPRAHNRITFYEGR
jgi:hypothetical protein